MWNSIRSEENGISPENCKFATMNNNFVFMHSNSCCKVQVVVINQVLKIYKSSLSQNFDEGFEQCMLSWFNFGAKIQITK